LRAWAHQQGWRFAVPRGTPNGWIVQPAQADTLCGRSLDWLEVVRRPA
jgi:hypothetical protein